MSLVVRYRRAPATQRRQIRYVAAASATLVVVLGATLLAIAVGVAGEGSHHPLLGEVVRALLGLGLAGLPLAIGIALLRPGAPVRDGVREG